MRFKVAGEEVVIARTGDRDEAGLHGMLELSMASAGRYQVPSFGTQKNDLNIQLLRQKPLDLPFNRGEVGSSQQDRLCALIVEQTVAHGTEDRALILSHKTGRGH